jgi:cytochrome c553
MFTKKLIIAMMFILMMAAGSVQAGGDAAKGAELAEDCAMCHGDDGKGDEDYPAIAGLDAAAHAKKLADFKGSDSEMADYVEEISEQDMHDIAAYYATLGG